MKRTIGTSDQVNVYIAELAAIKEAVDSVKVILSATPTPQGATVYSDCMSALQAIANPARQSGQSIIVHVNQSLCESKG